MKNLKASRDKIAMIVCLSLAAVLLGIWGVLEYRKEPVDSCECSCSF